MRVGCHWCGEAYEILRAAGYDVDEISVEDTPDLLAAYSDRVPVVVINGETISEGPAGLRTLAERLSDNRLSP
jgi:glutaredoxin